MSRAYCLAGLLVVLLAGCRDGVQPYDSSGDFGPRVDIGAVRLTYNVGGDYAPAWSSEGDTIYYSATSFPGLPIVTGGVLLAIPRIGGTARIVMPAVQVDVPERRWLTTPAISRNSRIAFFELNVMQPLNCVRPLLCTLDRDTFINQVSDTAFAQPVLSSGRLRVRAIEGNAPDVASRFVPLAGRQGDEQIGPGISFLTHHAFPFQRKFAESRVPALRPTWSPDGNQLVYSDGLRLLLWTPPQAAATVIPGTSDALWPAWSPAGNTIAFSVFPRTDSTRSSCVCYSTWVREPNGTISKQEIAEIHDRTVYGAPDPVGRLVLINTDGTSRRELGDGEAPAWLPDGSALIVRRGNALWRVPVNGGGAALLRNTQNATAPAVSPDGRYVAFARRNQGYDWDIWVVPLSDSN